MDYNQKVFEPHYYAVAFFVKHLACNRGLSDAMENLKHNREFWVFTADGHLKLATIAWCAVFGVYNEDLHWKKTPKGNLKQTQQDFRDRLYSKTGFKPKQWETYHKEMLDFRNKYVAHFNITEHYSPVPCFTTALQVAYAYEEWVRDLISPDRFDQPPLSLLYERDKAAAFSFSVINFNSYIIPKG